jgi:transcriptional regulator with XRE-family HTH domain
MARDRAALGEFLRARRDRITPAQAGITAFPGPRRVPGLRREELAHLAGVSADYLRRIEQGRQPHVSDEVIDALATALRLQDAERLHLRELAAPGRHHPSGVDWPQRLDPSLARMLATLEHTPALTLGRRGDVLGRTDLLVALLGEPFPPGSSFTRWLLQSSDSRTRIVNWSAFASASVAALRGEIGRHPHDATLRRLIDDVCRQDPQIAAWWSDHTVRDYQSVAKRIRHPLLGELDFDIEILQPTHDPDQRLIVYTTPTGSPSQEALLELSTWQRAAGNPDS